MKKVLKDMKKHLILLGELFIALIAIICLLFIVNNFVNTRYNRGNTSLYWRSV